MRYSEENRRRRKRKKPHLLLKVTIAILAVVGLYKFLMSDFFGVETITVTGNIYYTQSQIVELSGIVKGENIFRLRTGRVERALESDPYIRFAEAKKDLPGEMLVTVEERAEAVMVKMPAPTEAGEYIVVDFEGFILRICEQQEMIPVIEGLTPIDPAPGSPLKVKEVDMLGPSLKFFETVGKYDFYFSRIDVAGVIAQADIYDGLVCRGDLSAIEASIEEIRLIVADLNTQGISRGIINVSGTGTCSFTPEL